MNNDLIFELKKLYNIPAHSLEETPMINRCIEVFRFLGCNVKVQKDKKSGGRNLYITKGKLNNGEFYPCIAAHLDEVHRGRGKYKIFYDGEDSLFGWSISSNEQCGIGADDKNGIWVAIQAAKVLPKLKVVLFFGEEIGCVGSSIARMDFFNDCRYVLQVDRKGAHDLVTEINGRMVSDEFMEELQPLMDKYERVESFGLMTDVDILSTNGVGISCVNMSCGYYNPHTDREYTRLSELQATLDFVLEICISMTKRYEHTMKKTPRIFYSFGKPSSTYVPMDGDTEYDEIEYEKVSESEYLKKNLYSLFDYDQNYLKLTDDEIYARCFDSCEYLNKEDFMEILQQVRKDF